MPSKDNMSRMYASTGKKVSDVAKKNPNASKATDSAISKAEAMFSDMMRKGKVKDIDKAKSAVAKKTGVWPNGKTN